LGEFICSRSKKTNYRIMGINL